MIDPKKVKIFVGIPVLGDLKLETTMSLLRYVQERKYPSMVAFKPDTYTHTARNSLLYQAVEAKASHLMFIDGDMEFPPDAIDKLIDRNLDIVGGLYSTRTIDAVPVLRIHDKELNAVRSPFPHEINFNKLFKVAAVGTGFMLIKMSVFAKIDPPFFFHAECETFGLAKNPFPKNEVGEDVAFCLKAGQAGFDVWVDPLIKLGHVGKKTYSHDDIVASSRSFLHNENA
jgi:GT2 family glycosyltransferase